MVQGDGSQYSILPISFAIIAFCYLVALAIATFVDYFYDFYLIKFANLSEKRLIEKRVGSDFKRMQSFFRPSKLEKFDCEEAKNRLTIIKKLVTEKLTSQEISTIEKVTNAKNDASEAQIKNTEMSKPPYNTVAKIESTEIKAPVKESKDEEVSKKENVYESIDKLIHSRSREKSKTRLLIKKRGPTSAARPASTTRPTTSRSIMK
jgi:hypothetical protein